MKNNISQRDEWEQLFSLKHDIVTDAALNKFETGQLTEKQLKDLFNSLYEKVCKGATIVKREDGNWFLETVDMQLSPLKSDQIEQLMLALDDSSKKYLGITDESANYASYTQLIRSIPDFPKPGILFIDWLPIMNNSRAYQRLIADLARLVKDFKFTKVAALESRGFLLGVALATYFGVGFVPIRKKGKLPGVVISQDYSLEYGFDTIEIQDGMIHQEDSVLIVDDLLATGGTIKAANNLVSRFTQNIQDLFFIELKELRGGFQVDCPYKSLLKK